MRRHLRDIIDTNYSMVKSEVCGNINSKLDFENLCHIDLNKTGTFREFINILRATTFIGYENAFFINSEGAKVYISVNLRKEKK